MTIDQITRIANIFREGVFSDREVRIVEVYDNGYRKAVVAEVFSRDELAQTSNACAPEPHINLRRP